VGIGSGRSISGSVTDADGSLRGFIRRPDGSFKIFESPAGSAVFPAAIAKGYVIGRYPYRGYSHGFLRTP
jgi:hypothetical protein